jgi:hypothetical protein
MATLIAVQSVAMSALVAVLGARAIAHQGAAPARAAQGAMS